MTPGALRAALVGVALFCSAGTIRAEIPGVDNAGRAHTNYMLRCQGCHGPVGEGTIEGGVPDMRGYVGNFLKVVGGREFLVRVPGSANADLTDAQLAEVLNWILGTFSQNEVPHGYAPYTAAEVSDLRRMPLEDLPGTRAALVETFSSPDGANPER